MITGPFPINDVGPRHNLLHRHVRAERDVINQLPHRLVTGSGDSQRAERLGQCMGRIEWLPRPWQALVEVSSDNRPTSVDRFSDGRTQCLAEVDVLGPAVPVSPPASDMSVSPGNADTEHPVGDPVNGRRALDKPTPSGRCIEVPDERPWRSRPGNDLAALPCDRISPVRSAIDPMWILGPIVDRILSRDDDVGIEPTEMPNGPIMTSASGRGPLKIPSRNPHESAHWTSATTITSDPLARSARLAG